MRFHAGAILAIAVISTAMARADNMGLREDLTAAERSRAKAALAPPVRFDAVEPFEMMSGGAATNRAVPNEDVFSQPDPRLDAAAMEKFALGSAIFRKIWVSAPASTQASDGLGPLFNARSCEECHRRDGRGSELTNATGLVARLGNVAADGTMIADPLLGHQLQDRAVAGLASEGALATTWTEQSVTLGDGTVVMLRKPQYAVNRPDDQPTPDGLIISPRLAPPMFGLGLVEAIDTGDIEAHADPDDRDGDGISGRVNWVVDPSTGLTALGRFGWKASIPTLRSQSASAFSSDMGLSTDPFPAEEGDCTALQIDCLNRPNGVNPQLGPQEVSAEIMDLIEFYARHLAVPARREAGNAEILSGKEIFHSIGCAGCHRAKYVTRKDPSDPMTSFQLIWPYSDFLLHDMGPELADQGPDTSLSREWRTPPLWGIGLTSMVSHRESYLHDGRARDLTEAILWHAGEAKSAAARFAALKEPERARLIAFLKSL